MITEVDKIQIVSWILTRKCNLKCHYCRIVRNYDNKPSKYPYMSYYLKNEMSTDYVIDILYRLKKHNKNIFHIFYGGEPLLRKDLPEIISFCNDEKINYTIITNNTEEIQPLMEKLINKTGYLQGITSSVDPVIINQHETKSDRYKKSVSGFNRLIDLKDVCTDRVAEITVDNESLAHLPDLVELMTKNDISSDITFIDISKSEYYDFSNIIDENQLVNKSKTLMTSFSKILENDYQVHMADCLLPEMFCMLPSNYDCEMENGVHNLTIDSDGSVRLCLRIRGVITPKKKVHEYVTKDGELRSLRYAIKYDKDLWCKKCNWTCVIMSKILYNKDDSLDNLLHSNKRDTNNG